MIFDPGISFFKKSILALFAFILVYFGIMVLLTSLDFGDEFQQTLLVFVFILFGGFFLGYEIAKISSLHQSRFLILYVTLLILIIFGSFVMAAFMINWIARHVETYHVAFLIIDIICFSSAIGLVSGVIHLKYKSSINDARSDASQSQSELAVLQSQISPHFLFNTLNNLYGLSITDHKKIPDLILRLSDLLRYSVYDTKEKYVTLSSEISYIKNYIEFEKIRLGNKLLLTIHIDIDASTTQNIKIPPMLFIGFVENAFKHAKNTTGKSIQVEVHMTLWSGYLMFSVKNSFEPIITYSLPPNLKNNGLGLENVRRRLDILYDKKYDLKINQEDSFYNLMLSIPIK